MKRTIAIGVGAALLAAAPAGRAQEPEAKPAEAAKPPGKRLVVQFVETRLRGETATATRTFSLALHADAEPAHVFIGNKLTITVATQAPTTNFKNAGVTAEAKVETLPDGRYLAEKVSFEDSSVLGQGGLPAERVTAGNPTLGVVKARSYRLTVSEGETVPFASAVDILTGELVRVSFRVTAASMPKTAPAAVRPGAPLRAQLVLVRRRGETQIARRPYSVVFDPGKEAAEVFSGSQLSVQTVIEGGPAVALKDIGAGLRVLSAQRIADGRYGLVVRFSDGVLVEGKDGPRIRGFESESQLFVQPGETVTVASAVDPETGDVVDAEVTLEGVR
jgi:hypothetical protein